MHIKKQLLSLLPLYYLVHLINAYVDDETICVNGDDFQMFNIFFKSGNEARLELMDHNMEKQNHSLQEIDHKLEALQDDVNRQLGSLGSLQMRQELMEHDMRKQNKSLIEIEHKLQALEDNINRQFTSLENKIEKLLDIVTKVDTNDALSADEPKLCMNEKCSDIPLPKMCSDDNSMLCSNKKCLVKNSIYGAKSFWVSCDGEWTVIQRRINGSVDFYRVWKDYQQGFGDLDGEFWIGLDKLHSLTTIMGPVELLIKLRDFHNVERYAKFDSFSVGNETTNYMLATLGHYSGDAGDSLESHKGEKFSTHDKDNDSHSVVNCAELRESGWWHRRCGYSNLNGVHYDVGAIPNDKYESFIFWNSFRGYIKFTQMMIRPKKN